MIAHRAAVLHWLGDNEPASCSEIMQGTGVPRHQVVPFLSSRFICNRKRYPQQGDFPNWREYQNAYGAALNAPGRYCLTDSGRVELARQVSRLETT